MSLYFILCSISSAEIPQILDDRCPCQDHPQEQHEDLPVRSENPILSPQFWGRLGLGLSQSYYNQSLPQFIDLSFADNTMGPSVRVEVGAWLHGNWGAEVNYKNQPGELSNSSSLFILNGDYTIQSMSAELLWRRRPLKLHEKSETFLKLGIHQHDLPLLISRSPLLISRQLNSVRTLSLAVETHCEVTPRWRTESHLRYQHPFTAGSDEGGNLDISQNFTLDATVGALYRFTNDTTLGFFWSGEWFDFNYQYSNNNLGQSFSGFQNLFLSTFDLRLGVEF